MAISKVVYGTTTLVDLTSDTVTADGLVEGLTAHDAAGNTVAGKNPYAKAATDSTVTTQADLIAQIQAALDGKAAGGGVDTSSDTVTPDALVEGYTAHDATGAQITGTNPYQKEQTDAAVASIATAIEGKGVDVPDDAVIGDMAALIDGIDLGVDTSSDTVTPDALVVGHTAHNAAGVQIEGSNPFEKTETINTVSAQADLISQIQAALGGKGAGVDLSSDTVVAEVLVEGYTAHDSTGNVVVGTNPYEKTATDTTVNAQADLISQIQAALASKIAD